MATETTPVTTTPATAPLSPVPTTKSSRADKIASIKNETEAAPAPAAEPKVDAKPEVDAKQAAYEKYQAEERHKHQARRDRQEREAMTKELTELRAKKAEYEKFDQMARPGNEDEFLAEMERRYTGSESFPEGLLKYWKARATGDTESLTKREIDKAKAEFQKQIDEVKNKEKEREDAQTAAQKDYEARETANDAAAYLETLVKDKANERPLTAARMKAKGEKDLIGFANELVIPLIAKARASVGESINFRSKKDIDLIHEAVEALLSDMQISGETDEAEPANTRSAEPEEASPEHKNGAEKPVNTLSNDVVARRGSVAKTSKAKETRAEKIARIRAEGAD